MSKQTTASAHWEASQRIARIEGLMATAKDYSFPAGQVQVGIQMATVEVPWLLNYIEELKEQINGTAQQSPQKLAV
jgi:hypothetical protein